MGPLLLLPLALALAAQTGSQTAGQPGGLSTAERKGIADALFVGNLTLADLEFERKPFRDPYRIPLVDESLDRPLDAADSLLRLHRQGLASGSAALRAANVVLAGGPVRTTSATATPPPPAAEAAKVKPMPGIPTPVLQVATELAGSVAEASKEVREATKALDAKSFRQLMESLPQWAVEEPSIKFDFVQQPALPQAEILARLAKVDLVRIRKASIRLYDAVSAAKPRLAKLRSEAPFAGMWRGRLAGIQVEIGGTGRDVHNSRDAALCLDLGGDDTYRGRYGAGAGYAAVLVDVTGDDEYLLTDLALGAGLLGVGIAVEMDGNDVVRSRSLSLGAGLAGVGIYEDDNGFDMVRGVALTQGFGQFGIGLLFDRKGKDIYTSGLLAQGAGKTQGIGWLADPEGDDTYRCGGVVLNSPLFPDVHYSNGQGYGSGYREDTGGISGGIGLISDGSGDDAYVGETYCQAASYWFALGSLFDQAGHDTYSAYHYAQASAMHCTGAYLFDLAGEDGYLVKMGASHAIGHDYGVAFLLDRSGNDVYAARDSRPGIGNANGLGILVDAEGQDRYFGPPGAGNPGRGSGSLGVFADLGGDDVYAAGLADRQATAKEMWSVSLDADSGKTIPLEEAGAAVPRPGAQAFPGDAEMERLYRLATQWGVGTAQADVQKSLLKLQEIGVPALKWMVDRKLKDSDRLKNRAFASVIQLLGLEGRLLIAPKCASSNVDEARNALRITIDLRMQESAPHIPAALRNPKLERLAAQAAGPSLAREAVPELLALCASQDRLTALFALTSLADIADDQAVPTGQAMLSSPDLTLRKGALSLLAKFPEKARAIGRALMDTGDERSMRIGIELLAKVATEDELKRIAMRLRDPRPGVKMSAMTALNGRVPLESRPDLAVLMTDPNPLVRAVAARIDPGR